MSANRVCDMSCGAMHEFGLVLDKAGFDADIVHQIINSRGNTMAKAMRVALVGGSEKPIPAEPTEKFALLVDLGVITVPAEGVSLDRFLVKYGKMFYSHNKNITDKKFPNPSRILKPGDKLGVSAYKQIVPDTTTSAERMDFCRKQPGNVWIGPQGNSLVFEQKRDLLPKGFWYTAFDEAKHSWKDSGGDHRVSSLRAYSGGDWDWSLGVLGEVWSDGSAFLCFRDLSQTLETQSL